MMPMSCLCMNGPTRRWSRGWASCRRNGGRFMLLFHDTHHRAVSDAGRDAPIWRCRTTTRVLAFGEVLRQRYLKLGLGPPGLHLA